MVIMIHKIMSETRNHLHLALVVTRISIIEIEILAVASAEGVIQNAAHRSFKAVCA